MDEDRQVAPGFLPPRAPGGAPPPRFEAIPRAPVAPVQAPPPPPPVAGTAGRPVFVGRTSELGPSSATAIAGTAVGSISLLLLFLSVGLGYPLCGLMSLIALMLGVRAHRRIKAGAPGRPGQAKAAMWVGGIGILLAIAAAIIWAGLDASGFSPDDLRQWLEDRLEEQRAVPRDTGAPGDSVRS